MAEGSHQQNCTWIGKSGQKYRYRIYPVRTDFKTVPGNYIFAKRKANGYWVPVYIGETGDLSERFDNHHAALCINLNGATHIHAHKSSTNRQVRLNEETDLRQNYSPHCNQQ